MEARASMKEEVCYGISGSAAFYSYIWGYVTFYTICTSSSKFGTSTGSPKTTGLTSVP